MIGISTTVVVAGLNSAIANNENQAAVLRGEKVKVVLPMKATRNGYDNPCPPNMGVPGGQAVAHGDAYTPEELVKLKADAEARMPKLEVKPGGQAVAHGGEYSAEELEEFDKEFNPEKYKEKYKNATPTQPCVKPVKKDDKRPNSVIRFIKKFMGTTPTQDPSGN